MTYRPHTLRTPPVAALRPRRRKFHLLALAISCGLILSVSAAGSDLPADENLDDWSEQEWDLLLLGDEALDWRELEQEVRETSALPTREPGSTEGHLPEDPELEALTREIMNELGLGSWRREWDLSGGMGFTDNALLTAGSRQASAFSLLSGEFITFRLPGDTPDEFFIYLFGEWRRYFSVEDLQDEYLGVLQAGYKRPFGNRLNWETSWLTIFNDRVFGISPLEDEFLASPVVVLQHSWNQQWDFRIRRGWSLSGAFAVERSTFRRSADDYWQYRPSLGLVHETENTRWEGGLRTQRRDYDDRTQQDLEGFTIPDSRLQWNSFQPYLSGRVQWGENTRYEWRALAYFRSNRDIGTGYHHFRRTRLSNSLRARRGPWELTMDAVVQHTEYPRREIPEDRRYRLWNSQAGLRLSRSFGERHTLELSYTFEDSQSVRKLDGFTVHQTVLSYRSSF